MLKIRWPKWPRRFTYQKFDNFFQVSKFYYFKLNEMEIEKSQALWNTMYGLHWDYLETEENSTELLLKKDKLKGKLRKSDQCIV